MMAGAGSRGVRACFASVPAPLGRTSHDPPGAHTASRGFTTRHAPVPLSYACCDDASFTRQRVTTPPPAPLAQPQPWMCVHAAAAAHLFSSRPSNFSAMPDILRRVCVREILRVLCCKSSHLHHGPPAPNSTGRRSAPHPGHSAHAPQAVCVCVFVCVLRVYGDGGREQARVRGRANDATVPRVFMYFAQHIMPARTGARL
jgi:hypothetical protein